MVKPTLVAVEDVLWTAGDVSRFLRCSKSWVYEEAAAGRLPCVRVGEHTVRFERDAVRKYVEAGRKGGAR